MSVGMLYIYGLIEGMRLPNSGIPWPRLSVTIVIRACRECDSHSKSKNLMENVDIIAGFNSMGKELFTSIYHFDRCAKV